MPVIQYSQFSFKFLCGFVLTCFCINTVIGAVQNATNITEQENTEFVENPRKLLLGNIDNAKDGLPKITAYYNYGEYLYDEREFDAAIDQYLNALRIAKDCNNETQIAEVSNSLATTYWMSGNQEKSNEIYVLGLEHAEKTDSIRLIAKLSMNLACNYTYQGNYNKAIKLALHSLKLNEESNNLNRICYDYLSVGNIFKENNNTEKWEEYILKAYKMKDVDGCASISDIARIYNSLGGIAEMRAEHEKALAYYDTLLTISKEGNYRQGISVSLTNSSLIYQQFENPDKALELLIESEQYYGGNPYDTIYGNNTKAELYKSLGENNQALQLAKETIKKESIEYYSSEKLRCLQLLYELNFSLENYNEAYKWNDSLTANENRLRDVDLRRIVEEMETEYETEKKEQQIELLQAENKIREQEKVAFITSLIALLFLVVAGTLFYFKKKRENQIHSLVLRQQLLRSQMNPHFLFNALGSIQNFMYKNETKKAAGYLGNFARLTRSILEHSAEESISLFDEIEMLRNYIELEKMRLTGKFIYKIEVDESIETEFVNVPPMLLQPFVENAIKHGLKEVEGGLLYLNFTEKNNTILVKIQDNGLGINKANKHKSTTHRSMSMEIFEERRKILSKRTNENIDCKITDLSENGSGEEGTKVEICIPIIE